MLAHDKLTLTLYFHPVNYIVFILTELDKTILLV